MNNSNLSLPNVIDGVTGSHNIVNVIGGVTGSHNIVNVIDGVTGSYNIVNVIDGVTGSHNIVNMWKSHYEDLVNCLNKDKDVNNLCKNVEYEMDIQVSNSEITRP